MKKFMSILLVLGFLAGFIGSACLPVLAETIEIPITGEWKVWVPPPPEINFIANVSPVDLSMDIGTTDISVSRVIVNASETSKLILSIATFDDAQLTVSDAINFDGNNWIYFIMGTSLGGGGFYGSFGNQLIWHGNLLENNTIPLASSLDYQNLVIGDIGAVGAGNTMELTFQAHRKTDCKASLSGTLRFTVRGEVVI